MNHRITAISFALLISSLSLSAQDVPAAPLPSALTTAKTLFIGNAGDQENADCLRAYNDFYDGIASLTRFHLVSDPNQADLILEIHYEINLGAAAVTNDSHSLRQFRVVLIDPHSHVILWTLVERTNYALRQSNRDKNLDDTVTVLLHDFDLLVSPAPLPPSNKSRVTH
jgi:hypothetical protein